MKKLFILALAATLVVMFSVPATAAVQHKFGGYWRTRFFTYDSLNYLDQGAVQDQGIDTRTRINYAAQIHENLKFVSIFEFDAEWGRRGDAYSTSASYGARGADQIAIEVKRAMIDFNFANLQWEIGTQGFQDASGGFIYDDDYTGMKINYRTDTWIGSLRWIRLHEGQQDANGYDTDLFDLVFNVKAGNNRFAPFITYIRTNDVGDQRSTSTTTDSAGDTTTTTSYGRRDRLGLNADGQAMDLYYLGIRWDGKFGNWDVYATGIYEGGNVDDTRDVSAYVFDAKASVKMGQWGAWGRFMYLSGDDDTTDNDIEGWYTPGMVTQSVSDYAELWGDGQFDRTVPNDGHGKEVTDMMNFGLGVWYDVSKDWNLSLAWWNLNFAQDGPNSQQVNGLPRQSGGFGNGTDKSIGNEIDFWATWKVMKAMNLHLIFSYLILGDAIEPTTNSQDPWELGAQLEIKW